MDEHGWTWITAGVIERGHPDYDDLIEAEQIMRWIEDGAPPPEDSTAAEPTAEPVPVNLQLAVTKEQAGALLGGKSVDWIEKHVLPHVDSLRPSRAVLIPTAELERWVNENSGRAL